MPRVPGKRKEWVGFTSAGRAWTVDAISLSAAVGKFNSTLEQGEELQGVFLDAARLKPAAESTSINVVFVLNPKPKGMEPS